MNSANNTNNPYSINFFKYSQQLAQTTDFNPEKLNNSINLGFRIVHSDLKHKENFLPVALKEPGRLIGRESCTTKCTSYALSMFKSFNELRDRVQIIIKSNKNFLKRVGDHYAGVTITPDSGASTEISNSGHFDFHEAVTFIPFNSVNTHDKIL